MATEYFGDPQLNRLYAEVAKQLLKSASEPAKRTVVNLLAPLKGYESYLKETHKRVSTFRSLANPSESVDTASHYVAAKFLPASNKEPELSIEEFIDSLGHPRRYVVSGFAGYGKSMALRYMALSLFENPIGKIPLFVELRRLNALATPNLLTYVNLLYAQGGAVAQKVFENALTNGVFVFLLDGFDEVNHEIRQNIENQIKNISALYPNNSIVVSGRPSENKYSTWSDFELVKLQPMDKSMVEELVDKLDYDLGLKKRFKSNLDQLFEKHSSFLSTPLLAILMLMTFKKNASIPDKMHLFYSRAFDTLFNQHDATKEQYQRPRKTSLQIDEFSSLFSFFCFSTYVNEDYEFSRTEIVTQLRRAAGYVGSDANIEDVLYDLQESVCLIVSEGGEYFFVHRSFQEYFAALFLSTCPETDRDRFLEGDAARTWDQVLPMLFDMSADQIVPTWLASKMRGFVKDIGSKSNQMPPHRALYEEVYFERRGPDISAWHVASSKTGKTLGVINRMLSIPYTSRHVNTLVITDYIEANSSSFTESEDTFLIGREDDGRQDYSAPLEMFPDEVLEASGMIAAAKGSFEETKKVWKRIERERLLKTALMDELLQ